MYFYKMSNSNVFAYSYLKKELKSSEDKIEEIRKSFANSVFGAVAGTLLGMEAWNKLANFNIILRIIIVIAVLIGSYLVNNLITKKVLNVIAYISKLIVRKKGEVDKINLNERFHTEYITEAVMAISLSQQVMSIRNSSYKNNLKPIYLCQALYYFNKLLNDIQNEQNNFIQGAIIDSVGEKHFNALCNSVLFQLRSLLVFEKNFNNDYALIDSETKAYIDSLVEEYENIMSIRNN